MLGGLWNFKLFLPCDFIRKIKARTNIGHMALKSLEMVCENLGKFGEARREQECYEWRG